MKHSSRREFLGGVGKSALCATLGVAFANQLGFAGTLTRRELERLRFGALDPLVDLLQETTPNKLMPLVVGKLKSGTTLADLVGASALANARAYGGTNYNGYHALMAMVPSLEMAAQMPAPLGALPVLKVIHRNARFLQDSGDATHDALTPLEGSEADTNIVESVRAGNVSQAELRLAASVKRSRDQAYEQILTVVREDIDVHRVVLAWRAYDLQRLTGQDQALTLLRLPVRHCIEANANRVSHGKGPHEIVELLPRLMEQHKLAGLELGHRAVDDAWVEKLSDTIFSADRAAAAEAVAAALADGFDPAEVGRAMSLAAARLLLNDPGLTKEAPGKPLGSVHGASVGVHASDAANAWKHIARVSTPPSAFANLIVGAYHTAGQSGSVSATAHDHEHAACELKDPAALLSEIADRIRDRDQAGAMVAARRYVELKHAPEKLFAVLLEFAVSEDGALHAEKFFRTAQEEHGLARDAHRGLFLVALTRVMASHQGFPAPGVADARKLLSS